MTELEQALRELRVDWPATPDLATRVTARIAAETDAPTHRATRRRLRMRLAALGATLLVLAGGTLVASPAARSTVERWLGLHSVEIRRGPVPTPAPPGASLKLGRRTDPASARRATNLPVRPADAIYVGRLPGGDPVVSMLYAPRAGEKPSQVTGVAVLVQVFRASLHPYLRKSLAMANRVERVNDGYWIEGAHGFAYTTAHGTEFENQRVADTTLLIERDGLLIRVEGTMSKRDAIDIAANVR